MMAESDYIAEIQALEKAIVDAETFQEECAAVLKEAKAKTVAAVHSLRAYIRDTKTGQGSLFPAVDAEEETEGTREAREEDEARQDSNILDMHPGRE